jgi:hypothetical protein
MIKKRMSKTGFEVLQSGLQGHTKMPSLQNIVQQKLEEKMALGLLLN